MLLGIDVGGTFTDAVVIQDGQIVVQAKMLTSHENLLDGLLLALDEILRAIQATQLERVVLSTTLVTNALIQNEVDDVGLVIIPGPGVNVAAMFPKTPIILSGYIDHRGREVGGINKEEISGCSAQLANFNVFAVSGKFSVRNPQLEQEVFNLLNSVYHPPYISLGSQISGRLNFVRRTNSAYFNAAVWHKFNVFAGAITQALVKRKIMAPVYILKADGGTVPLVLAKAQPVETIFTGPAASVLGIMALQQSHGDVISLDIGGTTTDIALWHDGIPLFAERGARIFSYPTAVRAFWLKSVGVGGDSFVRRHNGELRIGPMRLGPAMALGGEKPTVSDALIAAGKANFGNKRLAELAMSRVADTGQSPIEAAEEVITTAGEIIVSAINDMITEHVTQPVYKVEDVINAVRFTPQLVIGVGGAAKGLAPQVAKLIGTESIIPSGSMVANAVGAAVARPTIDITLRADTEQGYFLIPEMGLRKSISGSRFSLAEARKLAYNYLAAKAQEVNIPETDMEIMYEEEFNVVKDFYTSGKIMLCRVQLKAGVLTPVSGREVW